MLLIFYDNLFLVAEKRAFVPKPKDAPQEAAVLPMQQTTVNIIIFFPSCDHFPNFSRCCVSRHLGFAEMFSV